MSVIHLSVSQFSCHCSFAVSQTNRDRLINRHSVSEQIGNPRFSPPLDTHGSMETELRVQSTALIGTLRNVDANVNEIGKKSNRFRLAKQQLCTCITLFCSFLCCHCTKDLKMPYFTFCGGREYKKTTFFFFSLTSIQSYRIHIQKKLPTIKQLKSSKFEATQFHF